MSAQHALPGHFYAVGVGPGAPDLLTVRALNLVREADMIVAPRSRMAQSSLALNVIRDYLDEQRQEIVEHVYAMVRDEERTMESWGAVAERIESACGAGRSVVQVTLGDPLVYSTSAYLLRILAERMPPDRLHLVAGITAMQAGASLLGKILTSQEDRLMIMPATDIAAVECAMQACETLVLYKCGKMIEELIELFTRHGLLDRVSLVSYAEQGDKQFISTHLPDARDQGYMATIIVELGRRTWKTLCVRE